MPFFEYVMQPISAPRTVLPPVYETTLTERFSSMATTGFSRR